LFAGFGMVFVWVFVPAVGITTLFAFRGELETAKGVVDRREKTHYSVGGDDHSDGTPVYAIHYTFADADENPHSGVSYSTGGGPSQGSRVTIEYRASEPETSRVRGLRAAPFGPWASFVVIFPIVGVGMLLTGLLRGRRGVRLLKHGHAALGTLQHKEPTNTTINNRRVFKLTFAFKADDGQEYEAIAKSNMPEKLEDEEQELLMYDPAAPQRAVMMDELPGSPRFDEFGQIRPSSMGASVRVLLIPLASLIGHGLYALLRYGH